METSSMYTAQLLVNRDNLKAKIDQFRMSDQDVSRELLTLKQKLFATEQLLKD